MKSRDQRILSTKKIPLIVLLILCLGWTAPQSTAGYPLAAQEPILRLQEAIRRISATPCLREGSVGLKVISLSYGETLVALNAEQQFIPASNVKLFTAAAALEKLHPDYTFLTQLLTEGKRKEETLEGNLYVKGFGDPLLVSEELWIMAEELWNTGIRIVEGDIVGDDSFFAGPERGTGWSDPTSPRAYNAKSGALSLNFNTIAVQISPGHRTGAPVQIALSPPTSYISLTNRAKTTAGRATALTVERIALKNGDRIVVSGILGVEASPQTFYRNISHPALFTTTVLREFLERYGIRIRGKVREGETPPHASLVVTHRSKPLSQILLGLNKFSNNFIAEQILKTLGAEEKGPPGSFEKGLIVVEETLATLGLARGTYTLKDGSGLSRFNRITPSQMVSLLETMYHRFSGGAEYIASLAIMGVDGSVADRLQQTPAQRRMRVKTGSLSGVNALSGYVETVEGEILAFALFMNQFSCGFYDAQALQDQIALLLVNFSRHS